jgi:hypothetical protein
MNSGSERPPHAEIGGQGSENFPRRLSLISSERLKALFEQASLVGGLPGDAAELGTYRGGSAIVIKRALPHKKVYGFESFEGLFNLSALDNLREQKGERGHALGDFAISSVWERNRIRALLARSGVSLIEGRFSDTNKNIADRQFCFAHFDGDTYQSTKEFIEFFYPRMVPGGRLVFDDFEWEATPGVEQALAEVFGNSGGVVVPLGHHQAVIVKDHIWH